MNSDFFERYHAQAGDVLNAILTNSRDCILLLSVAGEIEYASGSAAEALGLSETRQAIGKAWLNFWPESQQPELARAIAHAGRGDTVRYEGSTPGSDGGVRHWKVTLSPVRGVDGSITHLLKVSTDITAVVKAAERSRRDREEAEARIEHAGVVARELRHRLKNQLAVIGAVAKLLARHTQDAKDLARKLEDKLFALANAQDLLTISREEPIGTRSAVEQVLRASGAGDSVQIADMPGTPLPDESVQRIALILGELQTNALKYGALRDGGGVTLSGAVGDGVLTLIWREQCTRPVTPAGAGGGGFQLIDRLGSAGGQQPKIAWTDRGIIVEFHVHARTRSSDPGPLAKPTGRKRNGFGHEGESDDDPR